MEDTIFISQSKYAKNIVKKFGLDNGGHKRTPVATHLKMTKDESGISVDQSMYINMIGSLLYHTASRPDITCCRCVCKVSSWTKDDLSYSSEEDTKVHQ